MPTNDGKVIIQIDTNAAKAAQDFNALDTSINKVDKDSKNIPNDFNQVNSATSRMSSGLMTLKGGLIAAGVAFGAMKLKDFGAQIFEVSSQFEQLNVAFGVLAGQQAGAQLVKDLTDLANVTPMTTQGLADNARLLLSFGEASQNVITDLKLLGDITGGNQEKMNSMTLAFAQAGASGRLMGQDLLQMVNAGFNPLQQISEKTGKSMGQLKKEMEQGKIGFDQIKQAMIDATSEGGRFYGMMNKQSQTLQGQLSTLADKWGLVAKGIGDFFLPVAKSAVGVLIKMGDGVLYLQSQLSKLDHPIQRASIGLQKLFGIQKQSSLVFTMKSNIGSESDKASQALSKLSTGFKTSTPEVEKHAKKTKEAKTEYDLLQAKIAKLSESLKVMALHHQENTVAFQKGKSQLMQWQAQLDSANKAVEKASILNPYEKLQSDLQQATTEMQNLASASVVNADKFKTTKDRATELTRQLELIQQKTKIDTTSLGSYDMLSQKITKMRDDLQNMAASGQAGTPIFDKMKNDYVSATNEMKNINRQVTNAMGLDWENIGSSIRTDLASALTTPLQEGETAFTRLGNVALNVLSMIGQKVIENLLAEISLNQVLLGIKAAMAIFSGGASMIGDFGATAGLSSIAAKGNVYSGGQEVQAFAKGGVVSSPTLFPMANGGTGLMGEAGAEAVMPLRRTSNGRLGVEASGASPNITINNYADVNIDTIKTPNNEYIMNIRKVNAALASEKTQGAFNQRAQRASGKGITAA